MGRARSTLVTVALLFTGGCDRLVVLGSECERAVGDCAPFAESGPLRDGALPSPDASESPDDGSAEIAPDDAESPVANPVHFESLGIQNPSFERNGGLDGDLLLSNLIAELVPVAPVDYVFAEIPNWFTCLPFSVVSTSTPAAVDGGTAPTQFGDYLSFIANGTTVRQTLKTPLEVGASYSFEVKVISQSGGANNLVIQVSGATDACAPGAPLGRSARVKDAQDWTTICVTFTAVRPYSQLLVAPAYDGAAPAIPTRLSLDEFEQVPSCAAVP